MDNYSRNAKFDTVKYDEEAVLFHSMKYEMGFKYPLSIACYQLTQITKMKEDRLNEVRTMP